MNLTRVEVSKFKGIDSLAFEPGQMTLLTGRNNSGKTSLLEAVELAVDPSRIEQYGERVESLIAAGAESAEIKLNYKNKPRKRSREVNIKPIDKLERQKISGIISNKKEAGKIGYGILSHLDETELGLDEDTGHRMMTLIWNKVGSEVEEQWSEDMLTQSVELTVDHSLNTFVHVEQTPQGFVEAVTKNAASKTLDQLSDMAGLEKDEISDEVEILLTRIIEPFLYRMLNDGHIVSNDLEPIGTVGFRDELALTADEVDLGENDGAIRLSNIEEYLIENGLVENLDTLSLDQMVYEEDGEKYQVPYEFVGEGVKTLLGLLWELWEDTPELLLLEEPETHMHPRYVHEFVHWFVDVVRDRDVQVFLTTHDIDTIRSFFDFVEPSQKAFLREEFRLVQMDQTLPESYDYDEAESLSKELQTDLRGI